MQWPADPFHVRPGRGLEQVQRALDLRRERLPRRRRQQPHLANGGGRSQDFQVTAADR